MAQNISLYTFYYCLISEKEKHNNYYTAQMNVFSTYIPIIKGHCSNAILNTLCQSSRIQNTLALLNYENFITLQDAARRF